MKPLNKLLYIFAVQPQQSTQTMKKLLAIAVTLITLGLTSCSSDLEEPNNLIPVFIAKDGKDMLSPAQGFQSSKVDMYYMINGVKTRVLIEGSQLSESFYVNYSKKDQKYYLAFVANPNVDGNMESVTLLDFTTRVDTIVTSYREIESGATVEGVWHNGTLLTSSLKTGQILQINW